MKNSFLEYYKEILEKVSFDPDLLNKEYHKAIKSLNHSEVQQFENWIYERGLSSSLAPINQQNQIYCKQGFE